MRMFSYSEIKKIFLDKFLQALRRWNSWSLPTKLSLILGVFGVVLTIFAWMKPELGPKIIALLKPPSNQPKDWLEVRAERVRSATVEGLEHRIPSAEIVLAKLLR